MVNFWQNQNQEEAEGGHITAARSNEVPSERVGCEDAQPPKDQDKLVWQEVAERALGKLPQHRVASASAQTCGNTLMRKGSSIAKPAAMRLTTTS